MLLIIWDDDYLNKRRKKPQQQLLFYKIKLSIFTIDATRTFITMYTLFHIFYISISNNNFTNKKAPKATTTKNLILRDFQLYQIKFIKMTQIIYTCGKPGKGKLEYRKMYYSTQHLFYCEIRLLDLPILPVCTVNIPWISRFPPMIVQIRRYSNR